MTQESPISSPEADPHLNANGLSEQLRYRSTRGGALMIVSFGIQLLVGIGGTAILARMLTPRDFGYLAMVGTLITFVLTLREFLLAPAVHRQELSHEQASGLFWINAFASIVVAGGVAAMAPVLAWFFKEPRIQAMTLVMSVGVLISMQGMLHIGLLRRQMRFGAISFMEISASVVSVTVGVIAAQMGAEYWALVYQQLTIWIWQTAAAWLLCTWRPASRRASVFGTDEGMRSMLRYGQSATASRVVSYLSRNADAILVGHFLGAGPLGLYQKAYQWAMTPFWQIFIPMTPVAVASLSRLQDDPPRYRLYARNTLMGLFSLTLPGTALLLIEADRAILLLMGDRWLGSIPILRILSVGAYFSIFLAMTAWLYLSEGRTGDQLRWSLASAPVTILGVAVGLKWGAIGVASGFTIATILLAGPGVWFSLRRSPLTFGDVFGSCWRAAAASILAGLGLWLIRSTSGTNWHFVVQLIADSATYAILYAIVWLTLPGGVANWREFVRHFHELRQRSAA